MEYYVTMAMCCGCLCVIKGSTTLPWQCVGVVHVLLKGALRYHGEMDQ